MEISLSEARELVSTLQQKRCSGIDDLELITWLANRFRIPRLQVHEIYDHFYRGFQDGAASAQEVIDGKRDEPTPPNKPNPLYCAAYELGQRCFAEEFARSLERHRPRGCFAVLCIGVVLTAVATLV